MIDSVFIRADYSANAEIILSEADSVLSIPENAIDFKGDSTFVHVVISDQPKQVFQKRAIDIGLSDGINVEIKNGLTIDEKIRGEIIENK